MIPGLITRDTKKEDWKGIKEGIKERIIKTFGRSPAELAPTKNEYIELERYKAYRLEHRLEEKLV